jgi:signal transduction histidine kinase
MLHASAKVTLSPIITLIVLLLAASQPCCQNASRGHVEASAAEFEDLLQHARTSLFVDLALTIEQAELAYASAKASNNDVGCARALALKSYAQARSVSKLAAKATLQAALAALPEHAPTKAKAEVALAASLIHWNHDEPPECLEALRTALDCGEASQANEILVEANMLALCILGWPENPVEEMQRLTTLAEQANSPGLVIECRLMHSVAEQRIGHETWTAADFAAWQAECQHRGDRARTCYVAQSRARRLASEDAEQSLEIIEGCLATAKLLGDREQIALSCEFAARLHLHCKRPDRALVAIKEGLAALAGMGMNDRELTLCNTAAHIATLHGDHEAARSYSNRLRELQAQAAKAASSDQKRRLWQESTNLRKDLLASNRKHQAELKDMQLRQSYTLLVAGSVLFLVLALGSVMLLRDRRRLAKALSSSRELQAERAALEKSVQQIERLDSIGLLAGGFAHDFNNVLVSVRGNTQLALADPNITASQSELLEQVLLASDRAAGLCKDILNYAHAEPTPRTLVDMREIITGILSIARSGFGASIEVSMDLGEQPGLAHVDRTQIEQVILNLLINASEAIETQGHIHISVDSQQLSGKPPSGNWFGEFDGVPRECIAISITDDGQGMSAETIRRIFDPFFSTRFAGRGLGLATCFGILRRHEAFVEVQSTVGQGTQFTIYLPRQTAAMEPIEKPVIVPTPSQLPAIRLESSSPGKVLLVVDDEPSVCEVARAILEMDGHTVITACNGIDALELAEQYSDRLSIALLDVTMPGMDGPTLAKYLCGKVEDLSIVLMTGHAQSAVRTADRDSPLLQKPFDLQALRNTIRNCQVNMV